MRVLPLRAGESLCSGSIHWVPAPGGYATRVCRRALWFALPAGYPDLRGGAAVAESSAIVLLNSRRRFLPLYGFGAAAHLVLQVARHQRRSPSPRPETGGTALRADSGPISGRFRMNRLPTCWMPQSCSPPSALGAGALASVKKGGSGRAGPHERYSVFPLQPLWGENPQVSVNHAPGRRRVSRRRIPSRPSVGPYLHEANEALRALKHGEIHAAVLRWGAPGTGLQ
jgi:propanol-preferring alcohol dehydrogenase